MTTFKPGAVETINRPGRSTVYRVRWQNPVDGRTYPYSKLADVPDGEDFRSWLRSKGGRVTPQHPMIVQGTWRGGDAEETVLGDTRITFKAFAEANIEARGAKPLRKKALRGQLNNYFAGLHDKRMIDITEADIVEALTDLRCPRQLRLTGKSTKMGTKTLRPSTVVDYSWCLWGLFTAAVAAGTIPAHPFGKIELPKPENVRRRLSDEEFNLSIENYGALMSAAAAFDAQTLEVFRLILHTGLRIGEALALQVRHVDFEGERLLVRQQIDRTAKRKERESPVTTVKKGTDVERSSSERDVPVPAHVLSGLRAWMMQRGITETPNAYVFARPRCIRNSEPWSGSGWHRSRWLPILALAKSEYGLPSKRADGTPFAPTPHCLRHTFASRMLRAGMDLIEVSTLLGHADTKVTERIYIHSNAEELHARAREAAALAFPMDPGPAMPRRNGWFVGDDGKKRRQKT